METTLIQDIYAFIGATTILLLLVFGLILVIIYCCKASDFENDYYKTLPEEEKKVVDNFKHNSKLPFKYVFKKKENLNDEDK